MPKIYKEIGQIMLGLHLMLVTLHMRFTIKIEHGTHNWWSGVFEL